MRFFLIFVASAAIILFFSYDRLGDMPWMFSSQENGSKDAGGEVKMESGETSDGRALLFDSDIATGTEERLDQSIKSVEEEIRRTEEFLQKKTGEGVR